MKVYILTLVIFCFANTGSFAQKGFINEISDLSNELFGYITELKDNLEDLVLEENRGKVYRQLGYLKTDLKHYLIERRSLLNQLEQTNFNVNKKETLNQIKRLKSSLKNISNRLYKLSPLIDYHMFPLSGISYRIEMNSENPIDGTIMSTESQYVLVLSKLERLINGETVDKEELLDNAKEIYKDLQNSISCIEEIRCVIKPNRCE